MNTFLKRGLSLVSLLVVVATIAFTAAPAPARAAGTEDPVVVTGVMTGNSTLYTVTNAAVVSTGSTNLDIPPGKDLTLTVSTLGGVGQLTLGLNKSQDGQRTNFTTLWPVTAAFILGTTNVTSDAIISRTNFVGYKTVRWDQSITTNATGTLIRKVQWSWTN